MLQIGSLTLTNRLILGTGKYPSFEVMKACHERSGTELVTVAIRRAELGSERRDSILGWIDRETIALLPNTAGCYTAEEAIITAQLARELLGTNLLKLEVIGDPKTLFPDPIGTLRAAEELVKDGFEVLPYCSDDPILCKKLEEAGCVAVMPLAAPIGSGLGVCNPTKIQLIVENSSIPVIVDAGLGTASDAAIAMELGVDAILLNTAVAGADNPVQMAEAMRLAVEAGRLAHLAGRIPKKLYASASSPDQGRIES
ncbi:MAG: thiazole synthase [Myxococcota bacterium]|nr:thiazole synthase [Myxococcota bacterium]